MHIQTNKSDIITFKKKKKKKKHFIWQDRHFTWSSEPSEGLAACSAKEVPSFLSHFKTLSNGLALGIEPATSRSTVKRSAEWAIPATVN